MIAVTESVFGPANDLAAHRANNTAEDVLYNINHFMQLADSPDVEDHDTALEIEHLLRDKLTTRQNKAVTCYCCCAMTLEQTAEAMDCSPQNVSQLLRTALNAIKKAVSDDKA